MLERALTAQPDLDPALLNRITQSLGPSLPPVRALPAPWTLSLGAISICAIGAAGGAMLLGAYGIQELTTPQAGMIFATLAALAWLASSLCAAEVIPGSRVRITPWMLLTFTCAGLALVFALLFHDYQTEDFLSDGLTCLQTGLLFALPASLLAWWIFSRGFAVNPVAAGVATGTLGGLAGVTMLELHCPYFQVPHLAVWHVAVVPVSAAMGGLAGLTVAYWRGRAASS
jgi:hypothetical protein